MGQVLIPATILGSWASRSLKKISSRLESGAFNQNLKISLVLRVVCMSRIFTNCRKSQ